jgi:flagellar motor switch protein FliM
MAKILSQEEIDSLLDSAKVVDTRTTGTVPETSAKVITYNFRRPDRVSKEQIRSLHFLHDRFARNIAGSLSAYLRTSTEVTVASVEQFTYSEVLMSLPDPTAFYALSMQPVDGLCALELNPLVAFTMIDRMLGGRGRSVVPDRALTEIEQNVIDGVIKLVVDNLIDVWKSISEIHFRIQARETRPQMLQIAAPNETVILLGFAVKIAEMRGMLNLCVPASLIEAIGSRFAQGWHRTRREPTAAEARRLHDNLNRVPLSVAAVITTQIPARDICALRPGDVLSLGRNIRETVDVLVGSVPKFSGRLTMNENGVGVQVEQRHAPALRKLA